MSQKISEETFTKVVISCYHISRGKSLFGIRIQYCFQFICKSLNYWIISSLQVLKYYTLKERSALTNRVLLAYKLCSFD